MLAENVSRKAIRVNCRSPLRRGEDIYFAMRLFERLTDGVFFKPGSPRFDLIDTGFQWMPQRYTNSRRLSADSLISLINQMAVMPDAAHLFALRENALLGQDHGCWQA